MTRFFDAFEWPGSSGWIEIFVLAVLYYSVFRLFKGTRGAAILSGVLMLYGLLYVVTTVSHLDILNWILSQLMIYASLAFIVIFQPEIRNALARLGQQPVWKPAPPDLGKKTVDPIVRATNLLSKRKIGALIAIEREIGLRSYKETGTKINAVVSTELLMTIFFPHTPLHDGGVIVSDGRIRAAGCLFPLSHDEMLSKSHGTRHRAAIGITEETDAAVVVVSEETGTVSLAYNGRLRRGLDEDHLRRTLASLLRKKRSGRMRRRDKNAEARLKQLDLFSEPVEEDLSDV